MSFKFPNGNHKNFIVLKNYHSEGWKIHGETDDVEEAVKLRDEAIGFGAGETLMVRPLELSVYKPCD